MKQVFYNTAYIPKYKKTFCSQIAVPKYPRLCNSVSWSHVETNMLAVAMEKHGSDHCILLWDVHRGLSPGEAARGTSVNT